MIRAHDLLALMEWLPPVQRVEQAYRWDREVFFLVMNVQNGDALECQQLERIWRKAGNYGMMNLFAEILVQGELTMEDPFAAYLLMGDLAARAFIYSEEVEHQQEQRRIKEQAMVSSSRVVACAEWTIAVLQGFEAYEDAWPGEVIANWKERLRTVHDKFSIEEWASTMIQLCKDRAARANQVDVHPSTYFYTFRFQQN